MDDRTAGHRFRQRLWRLGDAKESGRRAGRGALSGSQCRRRTRGCWTAQGHCQSADSTAMQSSPPPGRSRSRPPRGAAGVADVGFRIPVGIPPDATWAGPATRSRQAQKEATTQPRRMAGVAALRQNEVITRTEAPGARGRAGVEEPPPVPGPTGPSVLPVATRNSQVPGPFSAECAFWRAGPDRDSRRLLRPLHGARPCRPRPKGALARTAAGRPRFGPRYAAPKGQAALRFGARLTATPDRTAAVLGRRSWRPEHPCPLPPGRAHPA